jgi:hypothetical protein
VGVVSVNNIFKFLAVITVLAAASVALAQSGGSDVADRLAKLSERLKKLDTNGNSMIDADEAATGVGKVLMDRVYPNGPPPYPIAISEILKAAEIQYRGGPASAASSAPPSGGAAAPTPPPASPAAVPTTHSRSPPAPSASPTNGPASSLSGSPAAPSSGTPLASGSLSKSSTASTATAAGDLKPPPTKGRLHTAKEFLLARGLPDWFMKQADEDGQITMAKYTDNWTPEKVAEFEKYDLNHDGIITADEVLKVEKQHGGK